MRRGSPAAPSQTVAKGHECSLGIDVGSTSLKMCLVAGGREVWAEVAPHEGDVPAATRALLTRRAVPPGVPTVVTGHEGRRQFRLGSVIEAIAIEQALNSLDLDVDAVVSIGAEDLVAYTIDGRRVQTSYAGSKCASGTGEFFAQQLRRMDLGLEAVDLPEVASARACRLSSRCSVFMKSDCTHKLNKGEATRHDLVLSLSQVMATKVVELLSKARVERGLVLLAGGGTRNRHVVHFVAAHLPGIELVTPAQATYFEAFGAAHLAACDGEPLPPPDRLFLPAHVAFRREAPLTSARDRVTIVPSRRSAVAAGRRYILGVDGGSTTTKAALIDFDTGEVAASHYGRTLGDPVAALRRSLAAIRDDVRARGVPLESITIPLASTTGSSRELLGVYCDTPAIYNEIMAHTAGATSYDPEIDTIFEIGGQDAKYVSLRNGVPVDYAMNEACSAGTGSFLEESASGDLDIRRAEDIGPIALDAEAPLRFGEHCSAFINSDIRKAIQQGAARPDIVAGLALSIVSNYVNRVVGNRRIGRHIVLQGGVAKNPAVPLAFAFLLSQPIVVPPDPELMGCLGVALLAKRKLAEGLLSEGAFSLDELIAQQVTYEHEYRCQACENDCPVRVMRVGERRFHFGGRCNKYANLRHRSEVPEGAVTDYVEVRRRLYFEEYAPPPEELEVPRPITVGIPDCFTVHSLWPLYAGFFHGLGVGVIRVTRPDADGATRCESSFCFPGEIAHGLVAALVRSQADYYFLPHVETFPSYERDVHACLCPIAQGLPYYLRAAFELDDGRVLRPVLKFSAGFEAGAEAMAEVAVQLGFSRDEGLAAFRKAVARQEACYRACRQIGRQVIEEARTAARPVIVLFGRPYNAFTPTANMGIPRKFLTRGYTVVPYDFLPIDEEPILPNMYWYYGQQNLKAAVLVKEHPNLFACMVTNFSCAPDSFILHYLRWVYNAKPALVLELDSHTADAGIDTRIEAFLDVVGGFRRAQVPDQPMMVDADWAIRFERNRGVVVHRRTGEVRTLQDRHVTLLWPSMGQRATELIAAISAGAGVDSVALAPPTERSLARARAVASGKECIPSLLVLGSFLEYFATHEADRERIYVLLMPTTTGPCRTGQYGVFYQNLFQELGYPNIVVLSPNSDTSYRELGPDFSRRAWVAITLSDYLKDVEYGLRALAVDPGAALDEFDRVFAEIKTAASTGLRPVFKGLPDWGRRLGLIPLRGSLVEARKVLVVGEIFVRQDDFSVSALIRGLTGAGIVPKVTGISEWVHYLDWQIVRRLRSADGRSRGWLRLFSSESRELLKIRIEMAWKASVERRVREGLGLSRLIPDAPHGMDRIMSRVGAFGTPDLDSEAILSPCSAAMAMDDGFDGVAVIAPFACLPGRIIEALYAPWARQRGYPVLCLENDGNPYPPNVLSRIEVFAHTVRRGKRKAGTVPPAEPAEPADTSVLASQL